MLIFFIILFFFYCYKTVMNKPISKNLQREIDRKSKEKQKLKFWVEKHKAVAQYNRKRNRTRSKEYGGKYRNRYDGY